MSGDELKAAAIRLYGSWGWQTKLATALEVDASSVRRWTSGQIPVPGPVSAAVKCFEACAALEVGDGTQREQTD